MRSLALLLVLFPVVCAANPLGDAVSRAAPGTWVEYDAQLVAGAGTPCCVDWHHGRAVRNACDLDDRSWNFTTDRDGVQDATLRVFVRRGPDGPDRVRAVGASCAIDTGSATVTALDAVDADSAASFLATAVPAMGRSGRGEAMGALALHAGRGAGDALARLAAPGQSESVRRDALFWLGNVRGAEGLPVIEDTLARETDHDILEHAVFALSQSEAARARPALRELAHSDRRSEVRGQALFWLSQNKDPETEALARATLTDGSGRKVVEKAVFALSQLPPSRAIPALEALVRDRSLDPKTRREALFWLGQQDDDRALDVFDEILGAAAADQEPGR
jgi:HEAT repeat protein